MCIQVRLRWRLRCLFFHPSLCCCSWLLYYLLGYNIFLLWVWSAAALEMFCDQQIPGIKFKPCVGRGAQTIVGAAKEKPSNPNSYGVGIGIHLFAKTRVLWTHRQHRPRAKGSRGSFTLSALSIYLITVLLIMLKPKHSFFNAVPQDIVCPVCLWCSALLEEDAIIWIWQRAQ